LALASALLLIGVEVGQPALFTENDGAAWAQIAWPEIANPQQTQPSNETLLLGINSTSVHVRDTVIFEGVLTPGRVAGILLTMTWPDGSWTNFRLQSNETGGYSYGMYIPMEGQFRASTSLMDTTAVMSNTISFVVSYRPITEPGNQTTTTNSTVPANNTVPANSTAPSNGGNPANAANATDWFPIGVAISAGAAFLAVLLVYVERREARRKANIHRKPDGV
jgi:hypothetical protein